ncbi:MAG: 1-acyl-sn-glycerol-3-phosphate acyltransferase [Alphaproteobacteria bacterium]|nr:1-acyl-sn-glycerol-3-phosphate acyltransferase [Alphaproteobacteria bacterium]
MTALRSALFNLLFYANLIILMILGLPALIFGRKAIFWLAKLWVRSSLFLLRVICGTKVEFRGAGNIPKGGLIIAPKHQSFWETFALLTYFDDFSFILKRELTWIPVFGWYLKRAEQIAIDRTSGRSALAQAMARSAEVLGAGRQIFIFPEGTRRKAGAEPAYKFGVAQIYSAENAPCLPVALTSGIFWPRRTFLRKPGTILVEFLEPIAPGLTKETFFELLQEKLETATDRLIAETVERDPSLRPAVAPEFFIRTRAEKQ